MSSSSSRGFHYAESQPHLPRRTQKSSPSSQTGTYIICFPVTLHKVLQRITVISSVTISRYAWRCPARVLFTPLPLQPDAYALLWSLHRQLESGLFKTDSVPYSCCNPRAYRPCIHKNVKEDKLHYHYNHETDMTIFLRGCAEGMTEHIRTRIFQILIYTFAGELVIQVLHICHFLHYIFCLFFVIIVVILVITSPSLSVQRPSVHYHNF